ncbi:MAG: hypothetical protein ACE5M4_15140 [Anaerolineales bacterium]
MIWLIVGLLVYVQIGALLLVWLLKGMSVEAGLKDWMILLLLWPLVIPFFRFLLHTRSMVRVLQDWEDRSE